MWFEVSGITQASTAVGGLCGKAGGSRRLPSASFPASVFHLFMGLLASVVKRAEPFVEWEEQHPVVHFEVSVVQIVEVVAH